MRKIFTLLAAFLAIAGSAVWGQTTIDLSQKYENGYHGDGFYYLSTSGFNFEDNLTKTFLLKGPNRGYGSFDVGTYGGDGSDITFLVEDNVDYSTVGARINVTDNCDLTLKSTGSGPLKLGELVWLARGGRLTFASDAILVRTASNRTASILYDSGSTSGHRDGMLDIGDNTLYFYDSMDELSSGNTSCLSVFTIKAGDKGKILMHSKVPGPIITGSSNSYRTYSSDKDDLGFLSIDYIEQIQPAPEEGTLTIVTAGGDPATDAVATFKPNGTYRGFAALLPAEENGTEYEIYYNGKQQKGIGYISTKGCKTDPTIVNKNLEVTYRFTVKPDSVTSVTHLRNRVISTLEADFTLLHDGPGELKAVYYTNDSENPEEESDEHVLLSDTTIKIATPKRFTITATPAKDYKLEKVVEVINEEVERPLENIEQGVPFDYNLSVSATLKAYFKYAFRTIAYDTGNSGSIFISYDNKRPSTYYEIPDTVKSIVVTAEPLFGNKLDGLSIREGDEVVLLNSGDTYTIKDLGGIVILANFVIDGAAAEEAIENSPSLETEGTLGDVVAPTLITESSDFNTGGDTGVSIKLVRTDAKETAESYITAYVAAEGEIGFEYENTYALDITPMYITLDGKSIKEAIINAGESVSVAFPYPEGLGADDFEGIAVLHMKKNGEFEYFSETNGNLVLQENYIELNGITSFSPFVLIYTKAEVDPEPEIPEFTTYYDLHITQSVGAKLVSRHGKDQVEEGGSFTLSLEKEEGYEDCNPTVYVKRGRSGEWQEVKLDEVSGYYQIRDVYTDIYVKVSGDGIYPVGNESIETSDTKVYSLNGMIVVETAQPKEVYVVTLAGAVVANAQVVGKQTFDNLATGVYIVRAGETIIKLQVRN